MKFTSVFLRNQCLKFPRINYHKFRMSNSKGEKMAGTQQLKILVALDFDHTVIDCNSDTYIDKLAPKKKLPAELKALYRKDGWTHYMGEVFKFLHENGVTEDDYLNCLSEIKLTEGMQEFFKGIPREKTEFIIISDSNSLFINHILKHHGFRDLFSEIFTNPAEFAEDGCLKIQMFHLQDWCTLSTKNLCKGEILANYVKLRAKQNISFSTIAYIGDGTNDFCPSLRLNECDVVFPRCGYSLVNYIPKMETERNLKIEAKAIPWDTAKDILKFLIPYYDKNILEIPKERLRRPVFLS